MLLINRIVPLVLAALLSACINLPEVGEPEVPDAGTPDGGPKPDSGVPADTTSPTITATTPLHGSTNVATSTQLVISFSEAMDVSTVQVNIAPTTALSSSTWVTGNTQLTLQPTVPLAQNTNYTFVVDGKDKAGNTLKDRKVFSFSTTGPAPDTTPPTILSVSPTNSAIGAPLNATMTVTFSEPMDKASAQAAFDITSPTGFNSGVFDWNAAGTEMTFNPDLDFAYGTDVTWRVSTTAKDLSANMLENSVTNTFRAMRQSTTTIPFNPETSGSALSPDYIKDSAIYHSASVGDYAPGSFRLFLGFKLESLPDDLSTINQAILKWHTTQQVNDPFATLGSLLLEHAYIGDQIALSPTDGPTNPQSKVQYESPALGSPLALSPSIIVAGIDVTMSVTNDWIERSNRNRHSQFRLRFEIPDNNNGRADRIISDWETTPTLAELEVTFEHP